MLLFSQKLLIFGESSVENLKQQSHFKICIEHLHFHVHMCIHTYTHMPLGILTQLNTKAKQLLFILREVHRYKAFYTFKKCVCFVKKFVAKLCCGKCTHENISNNSDVLDIPCIVTHAYIDSLCYTSLHPSVILLAEVQLTLRRCSLCKM